MNAPTALLTGCASGIGKAMAERLRPLGYRLLLTDFDEERLSAAAAELGWEREDAVMTRRLDVRDPAAWEQALDALVERWGKVDVVMNIAGYLSAGWVHEAKDADVERTIDVNVKGALFGTNAAARRMVAQGAGHIVNIASVAGLAPVAGVAIYSASKHAVRAYSIAAADELRKHGVAVTAVCPSVVATPMMDKQLDQPAAALVFSSKRPLEVDEVTRAVVERALVARPLELIITPPGSRLGLMLKVGNAFPRLLVGGAERMARLGARNQRRTRPSS